jgi:hypothetical protein
MKQKISLKRIKLEVMSDVEVNEQANIRYSNWLRAGRPRRRSSSSGGVKNFLYYMPSRADLEPTQPFRKSVLGTLSPEVKQLECEADHSPQTSAEIKKMWIYTFTSPYLFMA